MTVNETWRRLRNLFGRRDLDEGLDDELRFHIEQQTAKNLRAGMTPDEARRQARVRFGAVDGARESTRDEVRFIAVEDTWRDVRYAWRALRRAPGFTCAAVLTLGLGIGATAATFAVVYGVLLKPLPYPAADRLVSVSHTAPGINAGDMGAAGAMWFTYREEGRTLEQFGLWSGGAANVMGPGGPEEVRRVRATHDALRALGVPPALGRALRENDDAPGAPLTALLSHGYWQRRFGGDPSVLGRSLTVSGDAHEIVGVMPRGFRFIQSDADIIVPLRLNRSTLLLGGFNYGAVGRLRPGITADAARADLARMIPLWLAAWPPPPGLDAGAFESARFTPVVVPLKKTVVGDIDRMLWVLMGTILVVWLIACANVANLLLVRAEGRQQELSVRATLGAGWKRIAASLLVESLLLGAIGGVLAAGLAYAAVRTIVALAPARLPRVEELGIDPVVVLVIAVASVLSGLLFGALPIARQARPRLDTAVRDSGRTSSDSRGRHRTRNALVVVQVSLALMLLAGAGLMLRTFQALRTVDPGFTHPEEIQAVRIAIPATDVADAQVTQRQQALLDRMATVPGVTSVSFGSAVPLDGNQSWDPVFAEGQTYAATQVPPVRRFRFVAPGYFQTLGTPIVAGRDITWNEVHQRHPVAIVSESLAREFWGGPVAAVGRRVRERPDGTWREVVGVAGDVRDDGMHQPVPMTVYWPVLMNDFWGSAVEVQRSVTFVVRSRRAGTDALVEDLRAAVRDVSGNLPIGQVRTMTDLYDRSMALTSFALVMLGIAASMALVIGVIGIYGVVAYAVAQRRREIGIRLALGAQEGRLRGMFVRDGVRLAAVGVVCGLFGAFAATRLMSSLLFGVSALDPATYGLGALVLLAAAAVASFVPTVYATRTPLATVLRGE